MADVIVPTYGRPESLRRCLGSLLNQDLLPEQVLVVVRPEDTASGDVVADLNCDAAFPLRAIPVRRSGVVAAMTAGVAASSSDVLIFTDDDAVAPPSWLSGLLALIEQEGVGGAGGRDAIQGWGPPNKDQVGVFTRWGRFVGNHHLGSGGARDVHVLKGVNMGFRVDALALPGPGVLRGSGAEVHHELMISQWARSNGWRLVYDPRVTVRHEFAPRHGPDQRGNPTPGAIRDCAYNYIVAAQPLSRRLPSRAVMRSLLVGSRGDPSVGAAAVALVTGEREVLRRLVPSLAGKTLALGRILVGRQEVVTAHQLREASVSSCADSL